MYLKHNGTEGPFAAFCKLHKPRQRMHDEQTPAAPGLRAAAVIIPARAASEWILGCLRSVDAQSAPGWTVDVRVGVDGCPATAAVLKAAGRRFRESASCVGAYVMRNSLIALGAADAYVMFDADDEMTGGYLAALLSALDDRGGIVSPFKRDAGPDLAGPGRPSPMHGIHAFGPDVLDAVGGYLHHPVSMDNDLVERAALLGFGRTFVEGAQFLRRRHGGSLTGSPSTGPRSRVRRSAKRKAAAARREGRLKIQPRTTPLRETPPRETPPLDLVYTLGTGSRYGDWELLTSVKSFVNNVDGIGRVFVVGAAPPDVPGVDVVRIPCDDDPSWPADRNIARKILKACASPEISDPFLMAHDDHFATGRLNASAIPFWHRRRFGSKSKSKRYLARVAETAEAIRGLGVADPVFYDCHAPMPIHKSDYADAMERADWRRRDLLCKSVYGNLSDKEESVAFVDCKVGDVAPGLGARKIVSTRSMISPALRRWLSARASGRCGAPPAAQGAPEGGAAAQEAPAKIRRMSYAEYMRKVVGRDSRRRR